MKLVMMRQLVLAVMLVLAIHTGLHHLLQKYQLHQGMLPYGLNVLTMGAVWLIFHWYSSSISKLVETLDLGVKCFQDNDFSITIHNRRKDELGQIIDVYNDVATTIRQERMNLYQRELLLDTIIQETPVALILTDANGIVAYSNDAAKVLFNCHQKPDGEVFAPLLKALPESLYQASVDRTSGLYTVQQEQNKRVFYITCKVFTLNGAQHVLYLYKNMTSEISRQEIDLWKNAIRLMSHELNNSLAPISSLTNSAKQIIQKPEHIDMLPDILDTISQRTRRLHAFIEQYARFARLPKPSLQSIELEGFIKNHCAVM